MINILKLDDYTSELISLCAERDITVTMLDRIGTPRLTSLCVQASLDPWIGILHTEDYNRPALVYDLIEPFRADVEETAFKLFSKVKTTYDRYLEPCENGRCLTAEAKRRLIGKLEDRMEGRNGERGRGEDMRELAFGLARSLKKDSPPEECGESHVLSGVL